MALTELVKIKAGDVAYAESDVLSTLHVPREGRTSQDVLDTDNVLVQDIDSVLPNQLNMDNAGTYIGAGGALSMSNPVASGVRADAVSTGTPKDFINIKDVRVQGAVDPLDNTNASIEAYGVFLRNAKYSAVNGVDASGFTGGVAALGTTAGSISNVKARGTLYHPGSVRGGYGVFLDETREQLINGVQFTAGAGNDGRHMLYVSRGASGSAYDGCQNTIATNMIAKYTNKDDRNFWTVNVRKSTRGLLNNIISDGSNGGVSYNVENGNIEKHMSTGLNLKVLKYLDGVGVYGVSQTFTTTPVDYRYNGWLDSNMILEVKPKDGTVTGADCIGYNVSGKNGLLSNVVTNISTLGNLILIQPGASNVLISGVLDYMNDGVVGTPGAFITFTGTAGSCNNITVLGCKTSRPMFNRLDSVIDLTVDTPRKAVVTVVSGSTSMNDPSSLIQSVSYDSTSISIVLKPHVTQLAADTAVVQLGIDPGTEGFCLLRGTSAKTLNVRFYNTSGAVVNPGTSTVKVNLNLSC